jgi:hypothetical protein
VAYCKYHPDRPGVGVCMRCRGVVCDACTTRLNGINHCHSCLRALAARGEKQRPWTLGRSVAHGVALVAGWLPLFFLFYLLQGRLAP